MVCQIDVLLCDQKDTFCDVFISRLFWVSVKTLLDLLMGVKKERQKQIRQKNWKDLQSWVKTQGKNWAFLPGLQWHLLAHSPTVLSYA